VPSENVANRLPSDALDAFLDGILAELRDPADPIALNEIRAAFRKRVPFNLRSYAAAALILRAAGLSRAPGRPLAKEPLAPAARDQQNGPKEGRSADRLGRKPGREPRLKAAGKAKESARGVAEPRAEPRPGSREDREAQPPRPRFVGDGVTLFFSMGKRQRLYPRILIDLLIDVAGLAPVAIGEVRAFDNYSFADIDPQRSAAAISALDGYEFRGRKLSVGPAKKRDGQAVAD
jgi:hypothetical protein